MAILFGGMFTVLGLAIFEIVSSADNAVVAGETLAKMSEKARRWFLFWGIITSVFMVRGLAPWFIVWWVTPDIGFFEALMVAFNGDQKAAAAVEKAAPVLMCGGGTFLLFLFLRWLFGEQKVIGLAAEKFFNRQAAWFYTIGSATLTVMTWLAMKRDPMLAFAATVGSTAFFLSHGFREHAEKMEQELGSGAHSDLSKILFLEIIDSIFSIDGVLGAFAFTMNVPLILLGNGLGALVVRKLTIGSYEKIKEMPMLKNGAMYSVGALSLVMLLEAFGIHVPVWVAPLATMAIIGLAARTYLQGWVLEKFRKN